MRFHIFAALGALALAGCGSGEQQPAGSEGNATDSAAATAQTDPCTLATADEIGAVIGDKIVATTPGEGSCTWETADAQASSVTITLNQSDAAGQMKVARDAAGILGDIGAAAAEQGGAAGRDVNAMLSDSGDAPKIGDEAFFGANAELSVRKGNSYIAISPPMMRSRMSGGNPILSTEDRKRMAIAIAEKAVARLP